MFQAFAVHSSGLAAQVYMLATPQSPKEWLSGTGVCGMSALMSAAGANADARVSNGSGLSTHPLVYSLDLKNASWASGGPKEQGAIEALQQL